MDKKTNKKQKTKIISFRVTDELYEKIEKYGEGETDETGLKLNAALAARRLMLKGLKDLKKNK